MKNFDVIVIGGGISGLGIADEASAAGLSTLVLEAMTCCSQTSDNTLRIIHGGFRYLQSFDLSRVVKSLRDQTDLLREVPKALAPLPCLMPLARFGLKSGLPVACAGLLYAAFMKVGRSSLPSPTILGRREVESLAPFLKERVPHGALCWHDAVMIAPDLVRDYLVGRCVQRGVTIEENRPAASLRRIDGTFEVYDQRGTAWRAPKVVNAMGPWIDNLNVPRELQGPRPGWCKGINVTISRQLDPLYGIALQARDGRLFFCVPRGSGTAIGTWYEPHSADNLPPRVSEAEITTFLAAVNDVVGTGTIERDDVVHVDVGVLPVAPEDPGDTTPLAHERITARDGYIEVLSTKYTTFRSQARSVVGALIRC
jgi:glycerol-3-phosphate dehydrogenase